MNFNNLPNLLPSIGQKQPIQFSNDEKSAVNTQLNKIAKNYAEISPFHRSNIWESAWFGLKSCFLKLCGKLPLPNQELKFAKHLFRNLDQIPNVSNSNDLPFSYVLGCWSKMLKNCDPKFKDKADALKKCANYQKQIEEIKQCSWFKDTRLNNLETSIQKGIDKLPVGESLYLPGGLAMNVPGLIKKVIGDKLNSTFGLMQPIQMVYEVKRSENGQLVFRMFHQSLMMKFLMATSSTMKADEKDFDLFSDRFQNIAQSIQDPTNPDNLQELKQLLTESTSNEFTISDAILKDNLKKLLFTQVYSYEFERFGVFGKLRYVWKKWRSSKNGSAEELLQKSLQDFSAMKLIRVFQQFKQAAKTQNNGKLDLNLKMLTNADSEKIYETFEKALNIKEFKVQKVLMKTAVFLDIFEKTEGHLKNKEWRNWIKSTALNLIRSLEHNFADDKMLPEDLGAKFEAILKKLVAAEEASSDLFDLTPSPKKQKKASKQFEDPLLLSGRNVGMNKLSKLTNKDKNAKTAEALAIQGNNKELIRENYATHLKSLSDARDLDALSNSVSDAFVIIAQAHKEEYWNSLTPPELKKWSRFTLDLVRYLAQAHFGRGHNGPTPIEIYQMLHCMEVVQHLCHLNNDETQFQGYLITVTYFHQILEDRYLDLGPFRKEIFKILNKFSKDENGGIRFTFFGDDRDYLNKLAKNSPDRIKAKLLEKKLDNHTEWEDFNLIPDQINDLRKISWLAKAMMAKRYALLPNSWSSLITPRFGHDEYGRGYIKPEMVETIKNNYKNDGIRIDKKLHKLGEAPDFQYKNNVLFKSLRISPYEVYYIDPDWGTDRLNRERHLGADSIYKEIAEIPNVEMQSRMFQRIVANLDGEGLKDKISFRTDKGILDERYFFTGLSVDESADLQLMQTDSETRIPNTMACLCRNFRVLSDTHNGHEWQRLFTNNLFSNAAFFKYLQDHPEYAKVLVEDLEKLALTLIRSNQIRGSLFVMHLIERCRDTMQDLVHEVPYEEVTKSLDKIDALCASNLKHLTIWHQKSEKELLYKSEQRRIHQALLLHHAFKFYNAYYPDNISDLYKNKEVVNHLLMLLKSHFVTKQVPQPYDEINASHEEMIRNFVKFLLPLFEEKLKDANTRNEWLTALLPSEKRKETHSWKSDQSASNYISGDLQIDIQRGVIYKQGITDSLLPQKITNDAVCRSLFGVELLFSMQAKQWRITDGSKLGHIYEFTHQGIVYRIAIFNGENPFIYKLTQKSCLGNTWHQLHSLKLSDASQKPLIPKEVLAQSIWLDASGHKWFQENEQGERVCNGELRVKKQKTSLIKRLLNGKPVPAFIVKNMKKGVQGELLNPWKNEQMERFTSIAGTDQVVAYGKDGKVEKVCYPEFNLEYQWEARSKLWQCNSMQGYHLSNKTMRAVLPNLFSTNFTHYQVLEHATKPARILLAGEGYQKKSIAGVESRLIKHSYKTMQPMRDGQEAPVLYSYELDPVQGLKSNLPEGYLYLAYVLSTQSKYSHALYYLRKAQNIKLSITKEADVAAEQTERVERTRQILTWYGQLQSKSPHAKAVLLQVKLLMLDQLTLNAKNSDLKNEAEQLKKEIAIQFIEYTSFVEKGRIPIKLQLNMHEKSICTNLCHKTNLNLLQQILAQSVPKAQQQTFIETFQKINNSQSEIQQQINQLKEQVKINDAKPVEKAVQLDNSFTQEIFTDYADFTMSDQVDNCHKALEKSSAEFAKKLEKLTAQQDSEYLHEMSNELIHDLRLAVAKKGEVRKKLKIERIPELQSQLEKEIEPLRTSILKLKNEILLSFNLEHMTLQQTEEYKKRLKNIDESHEKLLEQALFCYAANDWHNLVDNGTIAQHDIGELETKICEFLIQSIHLQQIQKGLDLAQKYSAKPSDTLEGELLDQITLKRFYDPRKDIHSRAILLLEYDSKIVIRKNQIDNIRTMLSQENLFKHEALAGGKTSVLRNIISKIKADGRHLSGVITDEPLIEMHHELLENTASNAYGDRAWRFEFKRGDPTDQYALSLIVKNLYEMIVHHGRFDLTKRDLLSFQHAYVIKMEALMKTGEEAAKEIHAELDLFDDIFTLLETRARIISDELDKILDPEKEHNYAYGSDKQTLDATRCDAALDIVKWILTDKTFAEFKPLFENNKHYTMNAQQINQLIIGLAEKIHAIYTPNADLNTTVQYLTGRLHKDEAVKTHAELENFYNNSPHKLQLASFYKFMHLNLVLSNSFSKRGGVDYIRSNNHVLVKPNESNGKCAERSERGTEEEIIWYTCLNYMDKTLGGIKVEQIAEHVSREKAEAAKIAAENSELDIPQNDDFKQQFGIDLQLVTPHDYAKIAADIQNNPETLCEFLRKQVFPKTSMAPYKIVGTAYDVVNRCFKFEGSSGSSGSYRAFPDQIVKESHLVKQPLLDGNVMLAILKEFGADDIQLIDDKMNITSQIVSHLKPGDALIDLAPAFPGKTSEGIVEEVAQHLPDTNLRFIDQNDSVKIHTAGTNIAVAASSDLDLSSLITLIDQAHTRGTDLQLANNSIGYVTVGPNTKFSEFIQAVMRMRKLGKGQKVKLLVDATTWTKIGGNERNFPALIALLLSNEERAFKNLHYKGEKQKIKALSKNTIFKLMHRIRERNNRLRLWAGDGFQLRDYFIQKTRDDLIEAGKPKKTEDPIKVLRDIAIGESERLIEISENLIAAKLTVAAEAVYQTIDKLDAKATCRSNNDNILIDKNYLPKEVIWTEQELEMQQDVEREQEQEQAQEQEQEQAQEQEQHTVNMNASGDEWQSYASEISGLYDLMKTIQAAKDLKYDKKFPLEDWSWSKTRYEFDFPDYIHKNIANRNYFLQLNQFVPFYDDHIVLTGNFFLKTARGISDATGYANPRYYKYQVVNPWGGEKPGEKLSPGQNRVIRFPIVVDQRGATPTVYAVLGVPQEFDTRFKDINALNEQQQKDQGIDFYYYNMYRNGLDGRRTSWDEYPREVQRQIARTIVQVKLLSGETNLLNPTKNVTIINNEYEVFKDWLLECALLHDANKGKQLEFVTNLETNLKKYLREMRSSLFTAYPRSTMAKAFGLVKKMLL